MNQIEKVMHQYRLYKIADEIDLDHITNEIYEVLKNKVVEKNNQILIPAFNWRVKRFTRSINNLIKPEQRNILAIEINRLLNYATISETKNIEFINSCKEYKLKLFYDKFDDEQSLKNELLNIFK